jgi:FMN-dependent oxidoreductase (nitrilotriacetate monooxygenase family)
MTRNMHLGAVFMNGQTQWAMGEWALPGYRSADWTKPDGWQETAQMLERSKFDVMFFADSLAANDHYGGSPDAAIKYSLEFPEHDPLPMIPYLAAVTSQMGIAATYTSSYAHPYGPARTFQTLANLTGGRAAWNVVASSFVAEAANFGMDKVIAHDNRYDRADEFVEVCKKLWSSWEPGAILEDRENRIWSDPSKIHAIDHEGEYYSCRGPLNVIPPETGPPVLFGAGQSGRGLDFCARNVEVVFGIQFNVDGMKRQRETLHSKLESFDREPDSVPVMWGVFPILGETDEAAREKEQQIRENVPPEGGLAFMANHMGIDASNISVDTRLSEVDGESDFGSGISRALTTDFGEDATVGEMAQKYSSGLGLHVVGSPETVADQLEAYYDGSGGDGFLLLCSGIPGALKEFTEGVVPILQERGRFRKDYVGDTLRDHIQEKF